MDKKTQITETGSHIDILAGKIEKLIQDARQHVVAAVNTAMVYTYYEIGRYIVEDEQGGENRAIYGQELLKGLSNRLTHRLGKGWSVENLTLMRKFFITYSNPIEEKTENENSKHCLRNFQLSWSHYLKLMRITNLEERNFYEIEAIQNNWSLKELERQYDSSLYERLALSRNKEEVMNLSKKGLTERRFREFRKFYLTYPQLEPEIRLYAGTKLNHEIRQIASAEFDGFENQDNKIRRTASAELEQWQTDPDKILYKIPFSHLLFLCKIEDSLKRAFYESEIIKGCWSYSELERQVNSLYFERTGLSKDKNRLSKIVNQKSVALRPKDIVKNPMTLEFLGLQESNVVMENDLENAILNHLQHFLLELGDGFCYEATQKRILIDDEYFKIDLVFYHRILHCHFLVELKTDKFRHEYASQLNLYLNYYKNEVMQPADNPPIGLLLCTDYGETTVQYATAGLDENLFVSKYLVNLPSVDEIRKYIIEINKQ